MGEARAARGRSSRETAAVKRIVTVVTMGMGEVWEIRGGTEGYIGTGGLLRAINSSARRTPAQSYEIPFATNDALWRKAASGISYHYVNNLHLHNASNFSSPVIRVRLSFFLPSYLSSPIMVAIHSSAEAARESINEIQAQITKDRSRGWQKRAQKWAKGRKLLEKLLVSIRTVGYCIHTYRKLVGRPYLRIGSFLVDRVDRG